MGHGKNNKDELCVLCILLKLATAKGLIGLRIFGDNKLVIEWEIGKISWKIYYFV